LLELKWRLSLKEQIFYGLPYFLSSPTRRHSSLQLIAQQPRAVPLPELAAPSILGLEKNTGIEGDGITSDPRPALLGTAPPKSIVEIYCKSTFLVFQANPFDQSNGLHSSTNPWA
jgi:hypothetical protein